MNSTNDQTNDQDLTLESNSFTIEEFNSTCNNLSHQEFSLLHLNIRSLHKNFDSFETFLSTLNNFQFSLIGLTETWLHSNSPPLFNIENYKLLRQDRTVGRGGGVAMYAHKNLNPKIRPDIHIEGSEDLFVEITHDKHKNKIVGVIYRPPSSSFDTFLENLETCLQRLSNEHKDIYLMGDFNTDLSLPHNNLSRRLLNTLLSYAIRPHIDQPTRITNSTQTLIDNIFSNNYNDSLNGTIYSDISDHLPIFTISRIKTPIMSNKNNLGFHRKETKPNIDSLIADLSQEEWQDVYVEADVNSAYNVFIKKIRNLYDKNVPLVRNSSGKLRNKQPWITRGILKSILTRNRLYKLSLKQPNDVNRKKYKTYRNKLTSIIRLSRKMHFTQKLENSKGNTELMWKTINTLLNKQNSHSTDEFIVNDHKLSDPKQIANSFNTYFTNIGANLASNIPNNNRNFSQYLPRINNKSLFLNPTNIHEILEIVRLLKSTKSSGYDELSINVIKQIIHYIASPLCYIFNLSLSTGLFPQSMKTAKIIPIYKKNDASIISNYRPISLLPSLSKILEKIVYKRLYSFLDINKILISNQYGFRKNHSTDYAILQLCDQIAASLSKKEHIIGIFMDLSKAFDTIDHNILLKKLRTYGIRGTALDWFKSYLFNRRQFVSFKSSASNISSINCGVPQGSILGPLLFLIYINDIINAAPLFTYVLFADDTNVFYSHPNIHTLIDTINSELNKLSSWFKCNKLSLNIEKNNFIRFSNIHSQNLRHDDIFIDGLALNEKNDTKFLGITIDANLNWNKHIHNVCTSVSRATGILNKFRHFLPTKALTTIYNSLVLPHISYCNTAWGNSGITQINSILLLQKRAIRICSHSHYLSNTDPIFHKLNFLKANDIHYFQTAIFVYKFSKNILPLTFRDMFTLNTNIHSYPTSHSFDLHLSNPKIVLAHRSIRHHGPDVWNSLPSNIKSCTSLYSFKASLKKHLLSQYTI